MSSVTLLLIIVVAEFVLIVVFTLFFFLGRSRMDQILNSIQNSVTELHTFRKAGQDLERRTADSVQHLELVIAGTQTKGVAGENILEAVFAKLPPDWQVRNFRVGNHTVEFGLRLPNGLVLPIDSKWVATRLLERLGETDDPEERRILKAEIESVVLLKAKEVRKYIDPNITVNFGIAAVPDAVYDLWGGVHAEVFQQNVMLVSFSMFVPYLLLVFQTTLKNSQNIDLERLTSFLQNAEANLNDLQDELEGRFSRALTMLNNTRDAMSTSRSKAVRSLAGLQAGPNSSSLPAESSHDDGSDESSGQPKA